MTDFALPRPGLIFNHSPGGLVIKRYLNAIRPANGHSGGGGAFMLFTAETTSPVPPNTVMGAAATERDRFLTFLNVSGVEDFEAYGSAFPMDGEIITSNGNTATITAPSGVTSTNFAGRFNTTPAGSIFMECVGTNPSVKFTFGALLAGFGVFMTDPGDFNAQWTATYVDEFANSTTVNVPHVVGAPSGNLVFWGFLDTTGTRYVSVEFGANNAADGCGFDDVYLLTRAQII